ncbi:unnamed protein product, partial [Amoebophrya sp. A25]
EDPYNAEGQEERYEGGEDSFLYPVEAREEEHDASFSHTSEGLGRSRSCISMNNSNILEQAATGREMVMPYKGVPQRGARWRKSEMGFVFTSEDQGIQDPNEQRLHRAQSGDEVSDDFDAQRGDIKASEDYLSLDERRMEQDRDDALGQQQGRRSRERHGPQPRQGSEDKRDSINKEYQHQRYQGGERTTNKTSNFFYNYNKPARSDHHVNRRSHSRTPQPALT